MRFAAPCVLTIVLATAAAAGLHAQASVPEQLVLMDIPFYGAFANSIQAGDSALAALTTDSVRAGLARSGRFALLDRDRVRAAVIAATHSGVECSTDDCLREVSRTLGARWMVTGKLSKISNLVWYLSGQLTDVGTGHRYLEDEYELKGNAHEMVRGGSATLARRVVRAAALANRLTLEQVKARLAARTHDAAPDFTGAVLARLDLSGLDFTAAILVGADLQNARLTGARLLSADLTDANLAGADLTDANLDVTTLRRATFTSAKLVRASLFGTILEEADLRGADLSGARIFGYFRKAKLAGAVFRGANIGADPGNQSMGVMRSTFVGADLTGADLSDANLFKADLSYAILRDALLVRTNLRNTELVETDLTGADLTGAQLANADISGAIFTRARGVDRVPDLAEAKNRDKAIFDAP
jgi:uncharacterized protein YjbI with pentapeptide repeats